MKCEKKLSVIYWGDVFSL